MRSITEAPSITTINRSVSEINCFLRHAARSPAAAIRVGIKAKMRALATGFSETGVTRILQGASSPV